MATSNLFISKILKVDVKKVNARKRDWVLQQEITRLLRERRSTLDHSRAKALDIMLEALRRALR